MKPVDQTLFGKEVGNCFAACVASLLEVPIERIDINAATDQWLENTQEFLKTLGLFYLEIRIDVAKSYPTYELFGAPCIFMGQSPRGDFNHAVVGRIDHDKELNVAVFVTVHDPHHSRLGIVDGFPKGLGFLVPLNPQSLISK